MEGLGGCGTPGPSKPKKRLVLVRGLSLSARARGGFSRPSRLRACCLSER
jgi:hypothetical protein